MTWDRFLQLNCNGEPCWSGSPTFETEDVDSARADAARFHGWSHDPETDEDFCRKCTKIRGGN